MSIPDMVIRLCRMIMKIDLGRFNRRYFPFSPYISLLLIFIFYFRIETITDTLKNFPLFTRKLTDGHKCFLKIEFKGKWDINRSDENFTSENSFLNKERYKKWVWDHKNLCTLKKGKSGIIDLSSRIVFSSDKLKDKSFLFIGDSIIRLLYHSTIKQINPNYIVPTNPNTKHSNFSHYYRPKNLSFSFHWSPYINSIHQNLKPVFLDHSYDLVVVGVALWDALHIQNISNFKYEVNHFFDKSNLWFKKMVNHQSRTKKIWLLPTRIIDSKLTSVEKRNRINENAIKNYRDFIKNSSIAFYFDSIIDPTPLSENMESETKDGVHYSMKLYNVISESILEYFAMNLID